MDIEEIAVLAVRNEIVKYSNFLTAYIDTKEKIPMWDGYIYIYKFNNEYKSNKDYEGKIGVQVKGKKVTKLSRGNSKYTIDVDYLRAYQKDKKGVLLLVVEIVDYNETQLFYANLLPVDLASILKKVKSEQKTVTIDIKPIKEKSSSSLKMICLNFLKNSDKQLNIDIKDIKDISEISEMHIPIISEKNMINEYLFNNDIYAYSIDPITKKDIALPKLNNIKKYAVNKFIRVLVNDKEFYDAITTMEDKDTEMILIGKSMKIIFYKNNEKAMINFKICGNLYERINDIEFIIALSEYGYFKLNDKIYNMPEDFILNTNKEFLQSLKSDLPHLYNMKKTFESFGVKLETDFDKFSKKDWENIKLFMDFNNGNCAKKNEEIKLYKTKIADYNIIFLGVNKEGKHKIYNYFSDIENIIHACIFDENKKEIQISPYVNLTKENLIESSNLNINVMKKSFKRFSNNELVLEQYNNFMLQVLQAFDATKDNKFLDLAKYINKIIIEHVPQNVNYKINELQIIKRYREYTEQEYEELYNLRDTEKDSIIQCAISILLDNENDFKRLFNKLDENTKNNFRSFPIYNFVKSYS